MRQPLTSWRSVCPERSGGKEIRQANKSYLFCFFFDRTQRGKTIGAKAALDSVSVKRPLDFAEVNCNLAFVTRQADPRDDVANRVSRTFLRQFVVKLLDAKWEAAVYANNFLIRQKHLYLRATTSATFRRVAIRIGRNGWQLVALGLHLGL